MQDIASRVATRIQLGWGDVWTWTAIDADTKLIISYTLGQQRLRNGGPPLAAAKNRSHKHFQLDAAKIRRAQKALRTKTETETIELALDLVIAEHERDPSVREATERFVRSGIT